MAATVKKACFSELRDANGKAIDTAFPVSFRGSQYRVETVCATFLPGQKHGSPVLLIRPIGGGRVLQVRPYKVEAGGRSAWLT